MSKIKNIDAQEIQDSKKRPTLRVVVETDQGLFTASVPSGSSKGCNEAWELRDPDGRMKTAIQRIKDVIAPRLKGKDPRAQKEIDEILVSLDGTENKSYLGGNTMVGVSMAVSRAGARAMGLPLYQYINSLFSAHSSFSFKIPLGMFNLLEGGKHANNRLSVQEFLIIPFKKLFRENLLICDKFFKILQEELKKNNIDFQIGDEGGIAPSFSQTEQALFFLTNIKEKIKEDVKIGLDCAASEFYKKEKYIVDGKMLSRGELLEFYLDLLDRFSIYSLEDPFEEEDWEGFRLLMEKKSQEILIIGDDLLVTNPRRIKEAYSKKACNGAIIKLNQIGTVSETIEAIRLAKSFGWKVIVSHRSGETEDDFIADLAVGVSADFLKAGCPSQPERMAKYRRLLVIEEELKNSNMIKQ